MKHYDKPPRQRWLYLLAEKGLAKAILIIWTICFVAIAAALLLAKMVVSAFK